MSTTSIRIPDELKKRITRAADARGQSTHALIIEAIAEKAALCERRTEFYDCAEQRLGEIAESGMTVDWSEVKTWLRERIKGRNVEMPKARKFLR